MLQSKRGKANIDMVIYGQFTKYSPSVQGLGEKVLGGDDAFNSWPLVFRVTVTTIKGLFTENRLVIANLCCDVMTCSVTCVYWFS